MKLTIVGRRNVGKSTFVNTLAESGPDDSRQFEVAGGTTRDSVDVNFQRRSKPSRDRQPPDCAKRKSVRIGIGGGISSPPAQPQRPRADVRAMFFDAATKNQLRSTNSSSATSWETTINRSSLSSTNGTKYAAPGPRRKMGKVPSPPNSRRCLTPRFAVITGQSGKDVKTLLNPRVRLCTRQAKSRVTTRRIEPGSSRPDGTSNPATDGSRTAERRSFYCTQVSTEPPTRRVDVTDRSGSRKRFTNVTFLLVSGSPSLRRTEVPDQNCISKKRTRA